MFKYLRTINNSTHPTVIDTFILTPEDIADSYYIEVGSLVNISFGKISTDFKSTNPMYLVIAKSDDGTTAKCMRLFPGMVIEGTLVPGIELGVIEPGNFLDVTSDGFGKGTYFSQGNNERFELIDTGNKKSRIVSAVLL